MTTDALHRLQALRGLTRTGSAHTVLAQVQGDLQTVIEAVLDLAGHDDEHPTDEPAVGEQVTDSDWDDVWQRFEDGWHLWGRLGDDWSSWFRTWDYVQANYSPLRATTDDDRRRVGLPVRDKDASAESATAPESEAQPEGVSVDPETESGPESGAQGRIGWLLLYPDDDGRRLTQEVPGGWVDADDDGGLLWLAKDWPDAEFTPIRTLADDEVAVKREDLPAAIAALKAVAWGWSVADGEAARRNADRLCAALKEGR